MMENVQNRNDESVALFVMQNSKLILIIFGTLIS